MCPGFEEWGVDILVLISEFVVVAILSECMVAILSEWWSVPTTADHCGYIPDNCTVYVH